MDGYTEKGRIVWEFHGCAFHGCKKCFPRNRHIKMTPHKTHTMEDAYLKTLEKTMKLQQLGYIVIEAWECDVKAELKTNMRMATYFANHHLEEPIHPRDALFGGRTNALKLYHKCQDEEQIDLADVCSLYPFICKYASFPI